MERLTILRHGIAVPHGTEGIADDDRPLTPKGEKRTAKVARGLKRLGVKVDRIATSPLPRAHKTAEIAANALGGSELLDVVDDLRSGRSAESIRDWLKTRTESSLMIVGHNPAFSELVGLLVTGQARPQIAELETAGAAALAASPDGEWRLEWLATPKMLRKIAR